MLTKNVLQVLQVALLVLQVVLLALQAALHVQVLLVSSVLKMVQLTNVAVVRSLRVKQRVLHKHKQITSIRLLSQRLQLFTKLNCQKQLQRVILLPKWQLRLVTLLRR
mgnify:CR=1 FL=1